MLSYCVCVCTVYVRLYEVVFTCSLGRRVLSVSLDSFFSFTSHRSGTLFSSICRLFACCRLCRLCSGSVGYSQVNKHMLCPSLALVIRFCRISREIHIHSSAEHSPHTYALINQYVIRFTHSNGGMKCWDFFFFFFFFQFIERDDSSFWECYGSNNDKIYTIYAYYKMNRRGKKQQFMYTSIQYFIVFTFFLFFLLFREERRLRIHRIRYSDLSVQIAL